MSSVNVIVLENIRSLHNVGSFFRTADSAGFQKIYLCGYTGCPPDRRIEKVSLGAENFVEWESVEDTESLCIRLKEEGYELIAIEQTETATDLLEAQFQSEKTAFIFGNEVEGVTENILQKADRHLEIPMCGKKSSLNVSVAGGIVLYTVLEKNRRARK